MPRKDIDYDSFWNDYWAGASLEDLANDYGYSGVGAVKDAVAGVYMSKRKNEEGFDRDE